jgi:hypothetical protein
VSTPPITPELLALCKKERLKPLEACAAEGTRTVVLCTWSGGHAPQRFLVVENGRVLARVPEGKSQELIVPRPLRLALGRFLFWTKSESQRGKLMRTDVATLKTEPVGLAASKGRDGGNMTSLALDEAGHLLAALGVSDPDFPDISIVEVRTGKIIRPNCSELINARISELRWTGASTLECRNDLDETTVRIPWDRAKNAFGFEPQGPSDGQRRKEVLSNLTASAERGSLEAFRELIAEHVASLSQENLDGIAGGCLSGPLWKEKLAALLESGYKPGPVGLAFAALRKTADALRFLLDAGGDPQTRTLGGDTLLHFPGCAETVALLVSKGLDVNAAGRDGRRPLHAALEIAAVEALLAAGADPNARDNQGRTPLFDVSPDKARVLLAHGVPVDGPNHAGVTPLLHATRNIESDTYLIEALLAAGADPRVPDKRGISAYDVVSKPKPKPKWLAEVRALFDRNTRKRPS